MLMVTGVNIRIPNESDMTQLEKEEKGCVVKTPSSRSTAASPEISGAKIPAMMTKRKRILGTISSSAE
jgi:hypothetical protein